MLALLEQSPSFWHGNRYNVFKQLICDLGGHKSGIKMNVCYNKFHLRVSPSSVFNAETRITRIHLKSHRTSISVHWLVSSHCIRRPCGKIYKFLFTATLLKPKIVIVWYSEQHSDWNRTGVELIPGRGPELYFSKRFILKLYSDILYFFLLTIKPYT